MTGSSIKMHIVFAFTNVLLNMIGIIYYIISLKEDNSTGLTINI